jgi:hypothetical protein
MSAVPNGRAAMLPAAEARIAERAHIAAAGIVAVAAERKPVERMLEEPAARPAPAVLRQGAGNPAVGLPTAARRSPVPPGPRNKDSPFLKEERRVRSADISS